MTLRNKEAPVKNPNHKELTPRESFKAILGDSPLTDLIMVFREERGALTQKELIEKMSRWSLEEINEGIDKLDTMQGLEIPKNGMYRMKRTKVTNSIIGVQDAMADETRENRDLKYLDKAI